MADYSNKMADYKNKMADYKNKMADNRNKMTDLKVPVFVPAIELATITLSPTCTQPPDKLKCNFINHFSSGRPKFCVWKLSSLFTDKSYLRSMGLVTYLDVDSAGERVGGGEVDVPLRSDIPGGWEAAVELLYFRILED